jgi:CDP-diacylglycerol--inositol 3-phosphatidyltransferase
MDFYPTPLGLKPEWFLSFLGSHTAASLAKAAVNDPNGWPATIFHYIRELTWPQVMGAVTFPIFLVKQVINGVQFWKAAKVLVGIDLAERAHKREKQVS